MKVNFIKLSHQTYRLEIIKDNEVLLRKDLESKSLFRHDLMHYLVEKNSGLQHSFFGNFKNGEIENNTEIMKTEKIVAVLQNMNKDPQFSPEYYFQRFQEAYSAQGEQLPEYLNAKFIEVVVNEYLPLLKKWENMPTGETSVLGMEF